MRGRVTTARALLLRATVGRSLPVVGVFAAAVLTAAINVVSARHPTRFDWTSDALYTLSAATLDTLAGITEPIDVTVFLGRANPLHASTAEMLEAYRARAPLVKVRYVDPDRDPGELLALQTRYRIEAGRAENGRVVTDAIIIIARGEQRWFITHDDVVSYDEESGEASPHLERALTIGLRQVLVPTPVTVCFTIGHEEISIDDVSPTGLAELARRLEKENYAVREIDLGGNENPDLSPCSLTVVAAPDVPFSPAAAERVVAHFRAGGNVLVLASAGLSERLRVEERGLARITEAAGIGFAGGVVLETNPEARVPEGFGETFFAMPQNHAVTRALFRRGQPELQVLVALAQPLRAVDGETLPEVLLAATSSAATVIDLRALVDGTAGRPATGTRSEPTPPAVAMAAERGASPRNQPNEPGARVVTRRRMIVAPASIAFARNWRDPTLLGTRRFFEGALSWLSARSLLVDVPKRQSHPVGLSLSEGDLGEVWRYVMLYMPGSTAVLAVLILWRRRSKARRGLAHRRGAGS